MKRSILLGVALAQGACLSGCSGGVGPADDGEAGTVSLAICATDDCFNVPEEGTPNPPAQPRPPNPYGTPKTFNRSSLAFDSDTATLVNLQQPAPSGNVPWPLTAVPYVPEVPGAPVSVRSVQSNLWAFVSIDAGGLASTCLSQCSEPPAEVFNGNYGTYQATLKLHPRLDVELWEVVYVSSTPYSIPKATPNRVAEITATIDVRGFAECIGWETGSGHLHAMAGVDNVRIQRDTGILEDFADFIVPGFTAQKNAEIRNGLINQIIRGFSALPINGSPCATLGVSSDAVLWNPSPPVRVIGNVNTVTGVFTR